MKCKFHKFHKFAGMKSFCCVIVYIYMVIQPAPSSVDNPKYTIRRFCVGFFLFVWSNHKFIILLKFPDMIVPLQQQDSSQRDRPESEASRFWRSGYASVDCTGRSFFLWPLLLTWFNFNHSMDK